MINSKLLIAFTLGLTLSGCSQENNLEKNVLSIDTSQLKQKYNTKESLKLVLKTTPQAKVDSVVYLLNDQKIATSLENKPIDYPLNKSKLGKSKIQATAYSGNNSKDFTTNIEILSPIVPSFIDYKIVNTYNHDQQAYTQGLEFYNGFLYESTGNGTGGGTSKSGGTGKTGVSSVRKVDPTSGKVLQINNLPSSIFGEGCTILNDKLYQLTWQNNKGFIYDINTLEQIGSFDYFKNMEGWGLTNDGQYLYMSDGSETIYKIDPETFLPVDQIKVYTNKAAIEGVNEMEWVQGMIYANFYWQNAVGIIDPESGSIVNIIDFTGLVDKTTYHEDRDVFNGIAYNKQTDTFFVTGKNWDKIFEVKLLK
ncbi:glutaminyl-peptide cyclotransferase [Myroides sp. LJL119]